MSLKKEIYRLMIFACICSQFGQTGSRRFYRKRAYFPPISSNPSLYQSFRHPTLYFFVHLSRPSSRSIISSYTNTSCTQLHPTSLSLSILFLDSSSYSILLADSSRHTSYHSPPPYISLTHPPYFSLSHPTLLLDDSSRHTSYHSPPPYFLLLIHPTLLLALSSLPTILLSLIPLCFSLSILYHRSLIPPYFSLILNPPPSSRSLSNPTSVSCTYGSYAYFSLTQTNLLLPRSLPPYVTEHFVSSYFSSQVTIIPLSDYQLVIHNYCCTHHPLPHAFLPSHVHIKLAFLQFEPCKKSSLSVTTTD